MEPKALAAIECKEFGDRGALDGHEPLGAIQLPSQEWKLLASDLYQEGFCWAKTDHRVFETNVIGLATGGYLYGVSQFRVENVPLETNLAAPDLESRFHFVNGVAAAVVV